MALIICPECKKEVSERANMCPHCGFPIGEAENTPTELYKNEEKIYKSSCPHCGMEISNEDEYCESCGMRLKKYTLKDESVCTRAEKKKSVNNTALILNYSFGAIGCLLLVSILLSDGGIYGNRIPCVVSIGILACAILNYGALMSKEKILAYLVFLPAMIVFFGCIKGLSLAPAYLFLEVFAAITILYTMRQLKKENII